MNYKNLINKFYKQGYFIFDIKNKKKLNFLRNFIVKKIQLKIKDLKKLEKTHNFIVPSDLNSIKMKIYSEINNNKKFLKEYYEISKKELEIICGNEIAMQRKINLSIQMPHDDSALLPVHSDVWSGCSPFEVVVWTPLVDCKKTQSMFVYPKNFKKKNHKKKIKKFINIKYGQALIFTHQIEHGNEINKEKNTRWSLNCRFKSLLSPYGSKDIGETFLPVNILPATRLGIDYE